MFKLLTRDEFRTGVFARDKNRCVACGVAAADAHHIIERRLFPDGGYYLENGASVCGPCHLLAESTELSCIQLRDAIGIRSFPLPPHLYKDQAYDKWGNPVMPNGTRLRGELYGDASVMKVMQPVLHLFTDRVKYPRTYHLPWSPGVTNDDRIMDSLDAFKEGPVVVTVKMDGENTTMYRDYVHARSISYEAHPSRSRLKALHSTVQHDIPEGWRVCGENLYARHSIAYQNLNDHFLVFSVWNERNECLSWYDTYEWAGMLGLKTVPTLYYGDWVESLMRRMEPKEHDGDPCEGYVVRRADSFAYAQFRTHVGKFVRANHVQTHGHWMRSQVVPNGMRTK
jgi:hypothetical protein